MLHSHITGLLHSIELEQRVKVHKLNTRNVIDRFTVQHLIQILFNGSKGMRIAVSHGITQNSSVFTDKHKVHTPCVDTYCCNIQTAVGHFLQTTYHLEIQGIDVPVEMATCLYQIVGKTGNLLLFQTSVNDTADDGATTRGTQVNGKEVLLIFHCFISSLFCYC